MFKIGSRRMLRSNRCWGGIGRGDSFNSIRVNWKVGYFGFFISFLIFLK